ncbi:Putative transmembrane protein [Minicystis rosea]|nr:Putative transmembrane protein [Minicystis rosea]
MCDARANRWLGAALCFAAGALNVGGFLAAGQYTSYMTGQVSALAGHVAAGAFALGASAAAFLAGSAACAALLRRAQHGEFAWVMRCRPCHRARSSKPARIGM